MIFRSRLIVTFCFSVLFALATISSITRTVRVARISRVVKSRGRLGRPEAVGRACGEQSPKAPIRLQVESSRQFNLQQTRREIVEESSEIVPLGAALLRISLQKPVITADFDSQKVTQKIGRMADGRTGFRHVQAITFARRSQWDGSEQQMNWHRLPCFSLLTRELHHGHRLASRWWRSFRIIRPVRNSD